MMSNSPILGEGSVRGNRLSDFALAAKIDIHAILRRSYQNRLTASGGGLNGSTQHFNLFGKMECEP